MIVVNLISGPGVGKTILAHDLFSALKRKFITCDIAREIYKEWLRANNNNRHDQFMVFANQKARVLEFSDLEVVITDSPIIFPAIYDKTKDPLFASMVIKEFIQFKNLNYYIERDPKFPYEQEGRYQNLNGAKEVDNEVLTFINAYTLPYKKVIGIGQDTLDLIVEDILIALEKK